MLRTSLPDSELEHLLRIQFQALADADCDERVDQLLSSQAERRLTLNGSLVIECDGRISGVMTIARQPDGTVNFWPAVSVPGLDPFLARRIRRMLYSQAGSLFATDSCWIAQCLLTPEQVAESRELEMAGFPRLTELKFLARSLRKGPPPSGNSLPLGVECFQAEDNQQRFADVLERTWRGTLDCPELNGVRTADDALAGHRLAGKFAPERWLLFHLEGADVGILLLTEHPAERIWEVVYFGVTIEARGRGLGRRILAEGIRRARQSGVLELVLAVDVRNRPALKLYSDLGFRPFDRQVVHARVRPPLS